MSYDFATLNHPCDHFMVRERMFIHRDGRTLHSVQTPEVRMRGPLNSRNLTRLRVNGHLVAKDHPVYGWDLVEDERSIPPERKMKIQFKRPIRMMSLLIEAEYQSTPAYCSKCGGKGLVNDFQFTPLNTIQRVVGKRKLAQRGVKYLLTAKCQFYPNLTCRLKDFVGMKFGLSLTEDDIAMEASDALGKMQAVQQFQSRVQKLDPEEMLRSVDGVSVRRNPDDPTMVFVALNVSGYKGTTTELSFGMRVRA